MKNQNTRNVYLTLVTLLVFVGACQRKEEELKKSSIVIQMPSSQSLSEKIGAFAVVPSGRKICFAVNVTGPDLPSNAGSCQPTLGVTAGFVESGQTVAVDIKSGDNRKIELFMHLKETGDNTACPRITSPLPASLLTSTYAVGKVESLSLNEPQVTVNIPVDFPGVANHVAQTLGLPSSCIPASIPTGGPKVLSAAIGTVTSSSFQITGRVGLAVGGSSAISAGYHLQINNQ